MITTNLRPVPAASTRVREGRLGAPAPCSQHCTEHRIAREQLLTALERENRALREQLAEFLPSESEAP